MHKPSDTERFWFRNVLLVALGVLSAKTAVDLWRDGTVASAYSFFQAKLHDHVLEPVEKLARELFDAIRKREYVVTREECEESQEALHRMLRDFSQSSKGSTLIADMKERLRETLRDQQEAASAIADKLSGGRTGGGGGGTAVPPTQVGAATAAVLAADEFRPEQAMAALMNAYERELQAPVRGVVFGNLMTAILIQMQKLKVHTEAAMLTMDQVSECRSCCC